MVAALRAAIGPYTLYIKAVHVLSVAIWSFSTAVAWVNAKLWVGILVIVPMEAFDIYLSHLGGNKARVRATGDTERYERVIAASRGGALRRIGASYESALPSTSASCNSLAYRQLTRLQRRLASRRDTCRARRPTLVTRADGAGVGGPQLGAGVWLDRPHRIGHLPLTVDPGE